jgi:hypothetical protein
MGAEKVDAIFGGAVTSETVLVESTMYRLPDQSTAIASGILNCAFVPLPPTGLPALPFPAIVVVVPVEDILRTEEACMSIA